MKVLFALLLWIASTAAVLRLSLDGADLNQTTWTLENSNKSIKLPGRVPGGVFSDLEDNGVLKESIYYRMNDQVYKWVGRDNWTYSRSFDISADLLDKQVVNLVLHGADTLGEVVLNGVVLGEISNMYVRYVFPIKSIAKPSGNLLEVRFLSPVMSASKIFAEQEYLYPPVCDDLSPNITGECHVNMLRKMPCSFGWDWGPTFASMGIWKSVEVEGTNALILRDVTAHANKTDDTWEVLISLYAEVPTESFSGTVQAVLHLDNGETLNATSIVLHDGSEELVTSLVLSVNQSQVELWWPNGYGNQTLYTLEVAIRQGDDGGETDDDTEVRKTVRIGFRTVEIVEDVITEGKNGTTFYFRVNGVPVFAKGANWVPSNILPEKSYDRKALEILLYSAKEANMNMFRVWGGGLYESDTFYELADEVGIMIWQDFMFSDAAYPVNDAFISSVATEAKQTVLRIQHHPSIAVWCGNNEMEGGVTFIFHDDPNLAMYYADYRKLYIDTIKRAVDQVDPYRRFVGSSPTNGWLSEEANWIHPEPLSDLYGDTHYYNGQDDSWQPWHFAPFRFISEFGYEGMNSFENIKKVSEPSDWTLTSNFTIIRNRRAETFGEINRLIGYHLPLPEDDNSLEFYQLYIYYSQITQAMSLKTTIEKYRRDRDLVTADNKGRTMGALYWMYNDVWQSTTWSSIEFGGRWKLSQYYAKKFYSPTLVSFDQSEDGVLNVFLVSDLVDDVPVTVHLMIHSFDSFEPKWITDFPAILEAGLSYPAYSILNLTDWMWQYGCDISECFYHVVMSNGAGEMISENVLFPSDFHNVKLPSSNITMEVTKLSDTSVNVKLRADTVAVFVWLETSVDGVFSDNGFTMTFSEEDITFRTYGEPLDVEAFKSTLTVRDLSDSKPKNLSV